MTREEKMMVVQMRLDGRSLAEIAEKVGRNRQTVYKFLLSLAQGRAINGRKLEPSAWARPALARWLKDNCKSASSLARDMGVKVCTLYNWFRNGKNVPYYRSGTLDEISAYTKLPVEELLEFSADDQRGRRKEA